jgi:nucleoside-diphosphate-sugar epimerase
MGGRPVSVVVITGAAGLIGSMLRPRLARPHRTLRLVDLQPLTAGPGEEAIQASVTDYAFPAPDTFYGISKVATEGIAAMYHYRYGLDAICVRILSCFPRPTNVRMLSTWLSLPDAQVPQA